MTTAAEILALLPHRSVDVDTGDDALLVAVANSVELRKLIISDLILMVRVIDPGNAWTAVTPVAEGYRIKVDDGSGLVFDVWEVQPDGGGTTGADVPDFSDRSGNITDNDVTWTWKGVVGRVDPTALGNSPEAAEGVFLAGDMRWRSLIVPQSDNVAEIADPETALAADIAAKVNELIAALVDSTLMED